MRGLHRVLGVSLVVLVPIATATAQQPPQPSVPTQPRQTEWSWFGGATLAMRENTRFDPGVDVGLSIAIGNPSRPWSLRFDAEYAHAGFAGFTDSSFTPRPPAKDFDALGVQGTAIYELYTPPFHDPTYRGRVMPYLFGGVGAFLLPGSTPSSSLGVHGGLGVWLDQPPLESIELVGHDVVDSRSSQYVALVRRLSM